MKLLVFRCIAFVLPIIAALLSAELVLRLVPSLIGVPLLAHFPAPLRHHVAERLNYGSINDYTVIETAQRVDRGPPLYHPAPNSVFVSARDAADLKAGAVEVTRRDARGFCNPPEKGQIQHADIVVVGDSFTACTAVHAKDTSASYLGEIGPYITYNLGVEGVGLFEYVELLRRYGLALKPRAVVLNIYEGNDLRDAVRYYDFLHSGRDRRAGENAVEQALSHSYSAAVIYAAREWLLRDQIKLLFDRDRGHNYRYSARSQGTSIPLNIANQDRGEVRDASRLRSGEISLDLWTAPLAAFKDLSIANGFQGIVAYTPTMHTAYADTVVFEDGETADLVRDMSNVQRDWLAKKTSELGLTFIDLTPAFQKAAREGPLTHFPANVHLTPYGHRVSAIAWQAAIAKHLGEGETRSAD